MSSRPPLLPDAAGRFLASMAGKEASGAAFPTIEGYRIVDRLGSGGGGEVYRGFREGSENPVAIKVLRQARWGARQGRAWRELEILSQLRLSALPRVYDYGLTDGHLFIVTEYVEGQRLDLYAKELPLRDRVETLSRVADAVQSLHEHGILHRDIKPSNVLIDTSGLPVIIDLGIARLLAADVFETLTNDGEPIGTPAFMAPEQARGEREKISTRTDIYGLGATGFALLTGNTPHDTNTTLHEAVRRVAQDSPRDPRRLAPDFPKPLAAVLSRAVSVRAEDRYSSAASFAADLRRWLRGEPVQASPGPGLTRLFRWMLTHPALAAAIACLVLTIVTVFSAASAMWYLNLRPQTILIDQRQSQWARLQSAGGRTLAEWDTGVESGVIDSVLIEGRGGGKIALVAFGLDRDPRSALPASYAGTVCAFDAAKHGRLLWQSTTSTPAALRYAIPAQEGDDQYRPRKLMLVDIFEESPGKEIVVVFACKPYSPAAVQVYDTGGRLLYEAWHDGYIDTLHWLHDAGLLVMTGVDGDGIWRKRGELTLNNTYPQIVMAVRPSLGRVGDVYGPNPKRGALPAEWYKAVMPPDYSDKFEAVMALALPPPKFDAGRFVQLNLRAKAGPHSDGASLFLVLDEFGAIRERTVTSRWELIDGLPDPADVRLELPPLRTDLRD